MLNREECLKYLAEKVTDQIVICTIGIVGVGWHAYYRGEQSLYDCGAMGLASSIGLGVALAMPQRRVLVLDGDGALLMNLGSLATIAQQNPSNLTHLVFQNNVYESSGNQPLVNAEKIDFAGIARGAGAGEAYCIDSMDDFRKKVDLFLSARNHIFAVLKVNPAPRQQETGDKDYIASKARFMEAIQRSA